jgi:hypothetical protein
MIRLTAATGSSGPNIDHLVVPKAPFAASDDRFFEAEDLDPVTDMNGCNHAGEYSGASGRGNKTYVELGAPGSWIQWPRVIVTVAGLYTATFRYSNGDKKSRQCDLQVNGILVGTIPFITTRDEATKGPSSLDDWEQWSTTSLDTRLQVGSNVLRLTAGAGSSHPNIDYLILSDTDGGSDTPTANTSTSSIFEAENLDPSAEMTGCSPAGIFSGASGTGEYTYVSFLDVPGSWLQWNTVSGLEGDQELTFRFSNGHSEPCIMGMILNGVSVGAIVLFSTGNWSTWEASSVTVPLKGAENSIRLVVWVNSKGPNIDYVKIGTAGSDDSAAKEQPCKGSRLEPMEQLRRGERLCSENNVTELSLSNEGRLALWVSGTIAWDAQISGANSLRMQGDGNLVAIGDNGLLWTSQTVDKSRMAVSLFVRNVGSVVLRKNNVRIWCVDQAGIGCGDGSLPSPP